VLVGKLEGKRPIEDLGIDGKIILEWIFGKVCEGMAWMYRAQDRDRWLALVNTVMNLRLL
jgi:hypothetical protein